MMLNNYSYNYRFPKLTFKKLLTTVKGEIIAKAKIIAKIASRTLSQSLIKP